MLASMFQHSRGSPLHLVFITDAATQPLVAGLVRQSVGRHLSETIIRYSLRYMRLFPALRVEFSGNNIWGFTHYT